jgi:hypothetical protein
MVMLSFHGDDAWNPWRKVMMSPAPKVPGISLSLSLAALDDEGRKSFVCLLI